MRDKSFEAWWDSDPVRKQFHPDADARTAWQASRAVALEEAAKAGERSASLSKQMGHECLFRGAMNAVSAIRALINPPPEAGEQKP